MAEQKTEQAEETTRAITVQGANPLALMDDLDLHEIMANKLVPVPEWTYAFQVKGQQIEGVSVRGVQDAVRALATQGEAIRVVDVHMDLETPREAFFVARAGRYAIAPNGAEILTDTAIRGKRQPKYMKLRDGGEQFNEFWYEIGIAKASRNVMDAMLPEALRQWMKEQARKAPKNGAAAAPREPADRRRRARETQHRTVAAAGSTEQAPHPREQLNGALAAMRAAYTVGSERWNKAMAALHTTHKHGFDESDILRPSLLSDEECVALAAGITQALAAETKA